MSQTNIFNVAKHIIDSCGEMTTMKLQKLAYYCQAWSLAWDEKPLFEEDFEAWENGPVCRDLYEKHKGLFVVGKKFLNEIPKHIFLKEEAETIKAVLDYYGDKEPHWLIELTHKELPWKEARRGCADGARCNNIISKQSMQSYYGGLIAQNAQAQ